MPIGEIGGAAQGIEVGGGGDGGLVAMSLEPSLSPADVIVAGGGADGKSFKALEESSTGPESWRNYRAKASPA